MLVLGAAAPAAAIAVVAVFFGLRPDRPTTPAPAAEPGGTAQVTTMTMAETTVVDGELGYGPAEPIESKVAGTLTWLPAVGTVLARGDVLLRADEKPVPLLYGDLPMYRPLALDTAGPDVKQFETNLKALGYGGFTVDDRYTETTVAAVKRWQKRLRIEETGMVGIDAIVYVPGTVRVAARSARVGSPAQGQILTYTANTKVVTVTAPARSTPWAVAGTKVTVELPGGTRVEGVVSSVGSEASLPPAQGESNNTQGGGAANATVPVTVSVADQAALGPLNRTPVQVRYTAQQHPDVLTVPVAALLAPIDGGYAVEVVEDGGSRVIAVETGLFADGRVEIRGAGIAAGMTVRVPA
ncbi:MAG TPA: peptidoglycan-binding protein [Actinophytocola sp.]|uniref:peptidoglycan-binding protein n=1 Tax=Actinophytocola sp. TaxID=1872138 RepID=UPI002DDCF114|nr:peptidoglycan-binding protein [Actinophytocola sp.]HEV2779612.1 peptidoglycan-binding protein [Actinophytocola sp.]